MDDVVQGSLGDCYFLTAISALSNYPYLIREKFRTIEYNEIGYYEVILFIDGEWQVVFIDDYFVFDIDTEDHKPAFAFSKPNGLELWAVILEKAWAKVNGGYSLIVAGLIHEAFEVLTGFPSHHLLHQMVDKQDLFRRILDAKKENTLMGCGSNGATDKEDIDGIICGHAYTLADARANEEVELIRVRQ